MELLSAPAVALVVCALVMTALAVQTANARVVPVKVLST
jgi:hypothetical protein